MRLEKTPAYRRDKRKDYAVHSRERDDRNPIAQHAAKPAAKPKDNRQDDDTGIMFSLNDRY